MNQPIDDNQERSATIVMIVSIVGILLLGAPCFCYFGAGLFMGLDQFSSGRYKNPARQKKEKYVRPEKYNRKFPSSKTGKRYTRPAKYNRTFKKPETAVESKTSPAP